MVRYAAGVDAGGGKGWWLNGEDVRDGAVQHTEDVKNAKSAANNQITAVPRIPLSHYRSCQKNISAVPLYYILVGDIHPYICLAGKVIVYGKVQHSHEQNPHNKTPLRRHCKRFSHSVPDHDDGELAGHIIYLTGG